MTHVPDAQECEAKRWNSLGAIGSRLDYWLAKRTIGERIIAPARELPTRFVETTAGLIRLHDSGENTKPCVVMVPDGPNLIEHLTPLIQLLAHEVRVVCFDMPGFGYSIPAPSHVHSLNQGAQVILSVLDNLRIESATLAFSCANGFYALKAAGIAPHRIDGLMLSQTPSLPSMHAWVDRVIPRPLRIPVAGQIVSWMFRKKLVSSWYPMALPLATHRENFHNKAMDAIRHGACFCLAGVVQGLMRGVMPRLDEVKIPCTMVWGGSDPSHAMTDPLSLLQYVPDAQIVTFDDCGHFPDVEAHTRFGALLLEQVMRYAPR
jgi:pimeloyl-ACP methyl ester carboxylesterase